METNKTITEKWLIDNRSIYCLHETGRLKKGEPELCNKFYFNVQFDYPRGITEDMATEQVQKIHTAINNYDALVEENRKLKEVMNLLIKLGELEDLEFTDALDTVNFKTLVDEALQQSTEKEATKDE